VCDALTRAEQPLCPRCLAQPQLAVAVLQSRSSGLDAAAARLVQVPPPHHAGMLCLCGTARYQRGQLPKVSSLITPASWNVATVLTAFLWACVAAEPLWLPSEADCTRAEQTASAQLGAGEAQELEAFKRTVAGADLWALRGRRGAGGGHRPRRHRVRQPGLRRVLRAAQDGVGGGHGARAAAGGAGGAARLMVHVRHLAGKGGSGR
jgi:hypothetical protein